MEKDRTKKITMIVLIVAVIGLTVAFAALSQNLTINGSANVDAATWNIHFDNLGEAQISGEAIENEKPSINEDDRVRIDGINVTLNNPKDKVVYNVDLVNEGSIDAEISNIITPTLTEEQEKYLEFKVAYSDTDKELAIGDLLNKGETKHLTITIRYKDEIDPSDLPKDKQTISLSYELTFTQSDGESTVTTTPGEDEKEMFVWESDTVISGLTDYGIEKVKENGGHLVIPEGVTEIAGTSMEEVQETGYITKGFSPIAIGKININDLNQSEQILLDADIIKSVTFPSTLKKIGDMAFHMALGGANYSFSEEESYLTGKLIIPDSVEEVGNYAFAYSGFTSLTLSDNLKTIGDFAFSYYELSQDLVIPDSVITIGEWAFGHTHQTDKNGITSLTIGKNVKTIGDNAFYCHSITSEIYVPDNVESIGDAFDTYENCKFTVSIGKNTVITTNDGRFTCYHGHNDVGPTIRD